MRLRRWFTKRFLTRVEYRPDPFGRPQCWFVSRPDWWDVGCSSGITDVSVDIARLRLDLWQDDLFARHRASV